MHPRGDGKTRRLLLSNFSVMTRTVGFSPQYFCTEVFPRRTSFMDTSVVIWLVVSMFYVLEYILALFFSHFLCGPEGPGVFSFPSHPTSLPSVFRDPAWPFDSALVSVFWFRPCSPCGYLVWRILCDSVFVMFWLIGICTCFAVVLDALMAYQAPLGESCNLGIISLVHWHSTGFRTVLWSITCNWSV